MDAKEILELAEKIAHDISISRGMSEYNFHRVDAAEGFLHGIRHPKVLYPLVGYEIRTRMSEKERNELLAWAKTQKRYA